MSPFRRPRLLLLPAGFLALVLFVRPAPADAPADDDVIFRAMAAELERGMTLAAPSLDKPYWMKATVTDGAGYWVGASFGAVTGESGSKSSGLSTDVRVGNPDLDNTNFSGDFGSWRGWGGSGAPLDRDVDALRQALWLSLDGDYKTATEAIAKKRAYLASNNVKQRPPDMAAAPVVDLVQPRQELTVDRKKWRAVVKRVSAVFRSHPTAYDGDAWMSAGVSHQYFLSTDPARHRFATQGASFHISADTQAADGMPLSVSWEVLGRTEADLPDEAALVAKAEELAKRLEALAAAPTAEDYVGPVLFTGRAACTFFAQTVSAPLSDPREALGSDEGGKIVERLGRRIAARTLTARDDPTKTEWEGKPLRGHYPIDDDGVLPQPVTLIENGVLKTYYMSRVPTKRIAATNGHCRDGRGGPGNLFIEAKDGVPREALEKQLLEMCKEEDLEYGLLVEDFGRGYYSSWRSGGEVTLPAPSILWRLWRDGRRELIRGATFKGAPYRILKDILALGNDPTLLNSGSTSVVAPSVLVEELEVCRPTEEQSKPPYSPRPSFGN